ncbi:MAG TPA: SCO family protein [Chitinophagaceae bacterium]|nr:SCO family protein [Chitinophagaceae bacterium]
MSKKLFSYILFFTVLVAVFMIVLSFVPGFRKQSFPPLGYVQPFTFTTQDGKPFTEKEVAGKVAAVEFFFTTCKGICPRMNNNMRTVYNDFKNEQDFFILSHTCDPQTDSAARLKQYADSMGVDTNRWIFLTGRKDSLYNMARFSYKIDDPKNNVADIKDDFLHSQFIALVNKKGEVVKVFDGLKPSELAEMKKDIAKLLKQ